MSSLYIPNRDVTEEPDWDTFRGNNNRWIQGCRKGGGFVSFDAIVGQPLTASLWKTLMFTFGVQRLKVLAWDDWQTTEPALGISCTIYLDRNENVKDIHLFL